MKGDNIFGERTSDCDLKVIAEGRLTDLSLFKSAI